MNWRANVFRGVACALVLSALVLSAGGCESTPAKEPSPVAEEVPDPDRYPLGTAAGAFEAAFPGWTWATLRPERRAAVSTQIAQISQDGPPAWVSLRRTREASLDALRAGEVFGAETLAIVVGDSEGFEGEGLSLAQSEGLVSAARDVVSDRLTRLRFRELKDEQQEARQAAASLGVSPSTEALAEFASLFEAPLLLSLSVKVRFEPAQGDPAQGDPDLVGHLVGHLVGQGRALVYHRGTGTVLARVQGRRPEPLALGSATPLAGAADQVARELGDALAQEVSARLFERLYANQ